MLAVCSPPNSTGNYLGRYIKCACVCVYVQHISKVNMERGREAGENKSPQTFFPPSLHVCRPMYFLVISYMQLPNDKAQPENAASKYAHTWTPKVGRRMAFEGYWAVILPTLGGGGC